MSSTTQFATCPASIQTIAGLALGAARLDERGEDRLLVDPEIGLFGVFDGVGGHVDGAAAAELAATTVAAQVRENLPYCRNRHQAHDVLRAALHAADAAIEQYNAVAQQRLRRFRGDDGHGRAALDRHVVAARRPAWR